MAEKTAHKRGPGKPFKPGQSGNPTGRPKGSRTKINQAFIEALCADFEGHGQGVIATVRANEPSAYLRVVASLVPKEFKIERVDDLTDEQLDARIRAIAGALGLEVGIGRAADGKAEKDKPELVGKVSPLH